MIANIIAKIGFKEPISDVNLFNIQYSSIKNLLLDLKYSGETNCLVGMKESLVNKNYLDKLYNNYKTIENDY